LFLPSVNFTDKDIPTTSLSKSKTFDAKAARLDWDKLAEVSLSFELYQGFINCQNFSPGCKLLTTFAKKDLEVSLP